VDYPEVGDHPIFIAIGLPRFLGGVADADVLAAALGDGP